MAWPLAKCFYDLYPSMPYRKGHYRNADPYLRFHFRFLAPNQEWIEQGRMQRVWQQVEGQLNAFVGSTGFEDLCRTWVLAAGDREDLPFVPERVGRYWDSHTEIDVAAISWADQALLLGEARLKAHPVGVPVLDRLRAKAERIRPGREWAVHLALFSRAGFTRSLRQRAEADQVLLVSLDKMTSPA